MKYFYAPSTNGFYIDAVNDKKTIPKDAFEISEETHSSLIEEASGENKVITYIDKVLAVTDFVPPPPTWDDIRLKRNRLLVNSDWTQVPDADLSDDDKKAWKTYRQALRDITETYSTPEEVVWPELPTS